MLRRWRLGESSSQPVEGALWLSLLGQEHTEVQSLIQAPWARSQIQEGSAPSGLSPGWGRGTFLYQRGSFSGSNHQVDKRQMNKGKSPNSGHACVWGGPQCTGQSHTRMQDRPTDEREPRWAPGEGPRGPRRAPTGERRRCSGIPGLPRVGCLWQSAIRSKPPVQVLLGS